MLNLNPLLDHLPVYKPGRPIEEVAREIGVPFSDVAKLASNENPLGPSPEALSAMQSTIASVNLYPDGNAYFLKRCLIEKYDVLGSQIVLGNGSNELIEFVGHALLGPGTNIVVSQYCFAIYPIVAKLFGADVITVPAVEYGSDLPGMAAAVNSETKILFLANPNNPTGTLANAESVRALVSQIPSDVLIVIDEAYIEYLENPQDLLPLVRGGDLPNLFLMRTFSKIYGLAGLRIGYGLGGESLVGALEKIRQPFNCNSVSQAAAVAALSDVTHIEKSRDLNRRELARYETVCEEKEWQFVPSFANFILIRVGDGAGIYQGLLEQGIITRPMAGYQLPEWLRISIGTESENSRCIKVLCEIMEQGQ
jgi:histidinol-phosphate aminotransferase